MGEGVDLWPKLSNLEVSGKKKLPSFAGGRLTFLKLGGFQRVTVGICGIFESHG